MPMKFEGSSLNLRKGPVRVVADALKQKAMAQKGTVATPQGRLRAALCFFQEMRPRKRKTP